MEVVVVFLNLCRKEHLGIGKKQMAHERQKLLANEDSKDEDQSTDTLSFDTSLQRKLYSVTSKKVLSTAI